MRKVSSILLSVMLLAILFCGCAREDSPDQEILTERQSDPAEIVDPALEAQIASAEQLFSEMLLEEADWKDNTLDDYTAIIHTPLMPEQPEGEIGGGFQYALGNTGGAIFKKHLVTPVEDCWDGLTIVTDQGDERSMRLSFQEGIRNQAWGMGSIIGSDHFMMMDFYTPEEADSGQRYRLFEIDEDQQIVQTVNLDFLSGDGQEAPGEIIVDSLGNIHFTTTFMGTVDTVNENKNYYCITDADGELLTKYDYSGITTRLVSLYDGRVAIWSQLLSDEGIRSGSRLEYVEPDTGEIVLLVEFNRDAPNVFRDNTYYTLWDENTLLYADNRGLHLADLSGNMTEDVYIWSNHGIRFAQIEAMQTQENERINLIYSDYSSTGNLLCLELAEEKREIREIVFAVSPFMKEIYSPAVAEFNKKYPAYHIELKSDYDETALLTELIAGRGPVLVDTQLTGFDNHKKLWMPLEGLFSGAEWEDVLIPKAMEPGKIDGTLYGVVTSFGLTTVVIAEDEPTDWNYESFLDAIESNTSIEAIFNGGNNTWVFMVNFLIHGLEDNYLLDVESGTTYFDSDEFRRVLRLGTAYCDAGNYIEPGTPLLEGRVLCNTIDITRPEQIDLYRICYGEDANYIGYPAQNGSGHYIDSYAPLAVRATATDEEKKVAATFLRMLLSQENQLESSKDLNFRLSVRRDVLEEQINQVNEYTRAMAPGFSEIVLGDEYDREYDTRILYELLEKAQARKYFPSELNSILMEELDEYLAGTITEDVLIERLVKRVELYLAEQS